MSLRLINDLSEAGEKDISTIDGQDHGNLYRQYACQIQRTPRSYEAPVRNFRAAAYIRYETQPPKMCIRSQFRRVFRLYGDAEGD